MEINVLKSSFSGAETVLPPLFCPSFIVFGPSAQNTRAEKKVNEFLEVEVLAQEAEAFTGGFIATQ